MMENNLKIELQRCITAERMIEGIQSSISEQYAWSITLRNALITDASNLRLLYLCHTGNDALWV